MTDPSRQDPAGETKTTYGPYLFVATLIAILVFFWWFLIADHGVPGAS